MTAVLRVAKSLLAGLVLFLGFPLLGWGVMDLSGFMDHPARLGYAILTVLLQLIGGILFPEAGQNNPPGEKIVHRQKIALILMQILCIACVIAAPYSDRRDVLAIHDWNSLRFIGLGIIPIGFIVMLWAEKALGKQFSLQVTIQKDHRLITDGLYRHLRHPRYSGVAILFIGISLVFRSGLSLILVASMVLTMLWRIHDEEWLLHQQFGSDWEAYSRRSWRLIPFVY